MAKDSSNSGHGFNLWAFYFWFVEITFAIIGGTTEMWVYRQYMPPGQFSDVEAFARALVTQLAIVGFGAAGIKAMSSINGWGKWPMTVLAFAFALGFAFVTFDLMLVSAFAFRDSAALGIADEWPIPTPWGTIPGQQVTLFIIAGVPFFQWAMSVFGPVITKDRKPLTAEEIEQRGKAELAQIELNARKRLAQAKSLGATFAAVKVAAKGNDTTGVSTGVGIALADTNTPGIAIGDSDSGPLPAKVSRLHPRAKGPWFKEDIAALVELEYGIKMTSEAALTAVYEAGKEAKKGTAYCCSINQGRAWVKRHYGKTKGEGSAVERVG